MNYTKPEVAVLGQAVRVIESRTNKLGHSFDGKGVPQIANPAYDLDE
jgi:hypothetical protein